MLTKLALVILINFSNGSQITIPLNTDMTFAECDAGQRSVWTQEFETVAIDEEGPIPEIDAACIDPNQIMHVPYRTTADEH